MSLVWIDSFDNYGATDDTIPSPAGIVGRKYALTGVQNDTKVRTGRIGGYALQIRWSDAYISPGALTTNATMVVGFAFKMPVLANEHLVCLYDGSTLGTNLRLTSGGELAVYCGSTLLGTSSGANILADTWYYVEFKVFCATTTGTWAVHIGEVNIPCGTGVGTTKAGSNDYHTTFRFDAVINGSANALIIDDLYCLDGVDSGITGAPNNDFLGNMRVTTTRPITPDTAQIDFTPSAAVDHYTCMDEGVCNDDTDYVESQTSGHYDLYNFSTPTITGAIKGIMINVDCRETDATTFSVKTVCKSGSTTDVDAGQVIGTTNYVTRHRILESDPNTASLPWDVTTLTDAQFGLKVA